ncbi:stalk domain-containing protein [Brevibacillus migulae]|uniref:stalk domain-containing protein n=1 Tax=Brevibacillus migulae TaxID=1644114 RepID=UPI001431198C|nr:protease complex subunit PrcB family protein [Brevibacillus migulae]
MNRQTAIALVLSGLFFVNAPANAATPIQITVQQQPVTFQYKPILLHGRTLIAGEDLARMLQGTWTTQQGLGKLTINRISLTFKPGTNEVMTNSWQKIDQGAVVQGKTIYVPLRWVTEQLGIPLTWKNGKIDLGKAGEPDSFSLLTSAALTAQDKAFIEERKQAKGVHQQGNLYVISRGEVPNPGYGIEFVKQELSWEQVSVYVRMTSPEPGRMYPQVISYPYMAGKIDLSPYTTIQFIDIDTGEPLFQE